MTVSLILGPWSRQGGSEQQGSPSSFCRSKDAQAPCRAHRGCTALPVLPLLDCSRAISIAPKTVAQVTPRGWAELFSKLGPMTD